jgi:putative restriction endonuclease
MRTMADDSKSTYHYSFKVRKGKVSYSEKANSVLIRQPQYQYPILLFSKAANSYLFEGTFSVRDIEASHVVLERGLGLANGQRLPQEEALYQEGGKKYVTHLLAERNRSVVKILKDRPSANCEICNVRFSERYGVDYIEAHHKVPVATYSSTYTVTPEDFALLCPNCHRAVHIYMKKEGLEYSQIKKRLQRGAA